MAPAATESKPMYQKDEKALCFHGELLYEAKVLEIRKQDPKDKQSPYEYRVHYKGWKNTWDDWVAQDRLRKLTDDNKELAANLRKELTTQAQPKAAAKPSTSSKSKKPISEGGSGRGSEERNSSVPAGSRGTKRQRDNDIEKEDNFHARPSIRITIPDHLKNLLVDDWENISKSMLLIPLPVQTPANFIIDSYFNEEKQNRRLGSPEGDVLEEFCAGMKVYFDKSLGKILLYRFERNQLAEVRKLWESGKYPEWEGKGPGDCYGAEHLCRMLVNLPEMIAQTNMDTQSVSRLKEEISKFCTWLARNANKYFVKRYDTPSQEYIESAR